MGNDKRKGFLLRFSIEISFLSFSIISAIFAYLLSKELMFSSGVFLIYLAISILFLIPLAKKNRRQKTRKDEVYSFLLDFISFFQKKSLNDAFSSAILALNNPSLDPILERISSLPVLEKASYFEEYFSSPFYSSFYQLLKRESNVNKDFLSEIAQLANEAGRVRNKLFHEDEIKKKYCLNLCFCWLTSFLLIAFLRFSLMNLFSFDSLKEFSLVLYSFYFGLLLCSVTFFAFCAYGDNGEIKKNEIQTK